MISTTKILDIRIFPPIAIARFGSSETPLEAYRVEINTENPLDFRTIVPEANYVIDAQGNISIAPATEAIQFKTSKADKRAIKPVSPFLELFVRTTADENNFVPLTTDLLQELGLSTDDLEFKLEMGNHKIYRRTNDVNDKIVLELNSNNLHEKHLKYALDGHCNNFKTGATIPLGYFQFIQPKTPGNAQEDGLNQIRFRFTPPAGKVYGPDIPYIENLLKKDVLSADYKSYLSDLVKNDPDVLLYDSNKGTWTSYKENEGPTKTNPAQIFAGYDEGIWQYSIGLFDDASDGWLEVTLHTSDQDFKARASLATAPPAFAPDILPIRVVTDELEQILYGPEFDENELVHIDDIQEIIRRAFETIRLMNTAIMNGNPYYGRSGTASTMPRQDTNDTHRAFEPVMSPDIVDNFAVRQLHERIYNSLDTGIAPWFINSIRMPYEIGKLDNETRRKMPAMMRGADARALTLTYRQINTIIKAITQGSLKKLISEANSPGNTIAYKDYKAQLHYKGKGNPFCILPSAAISNCFPGLEFDFKNLWIRTFEGIELSENNNYVMNTEKDFNQLMHRRLVGIMEKPTMVETVGPILPNGTPDNNTSLATASNPDSAVFMEWSNNLIYTLQRQGQEVYCYFTADAIEKEVLITADDLKAFKKAIDNDGAMYYTTDSGVKLQWVALKVRSFFQEDSVEFSTGLVQPGEFTRGLCSPWQNDFRECACYYWAASRPDYVNIENNKTGFTTGDNWMAKERTGTYIPDNRTDTHLLSYTDLFRDWEHDLHFIIKGNDETFSD